MRDAVWSIPGKVSAPLRPDGTVLVNYAPHTGKDAFSRYSIYDVAGSPKSGGGRFKDKIVVIGGSYLASNDFSYVPVQSGIGRRERRISQLGSPRQPAPHAP